MPTGRTVELTVLCEGSTERNFVTQVLHPHLVHHHVFAKPVGLDGKLTKSGGKAIVGPEISAKIGVAAIRAKCPHFNQWLTRLEGLATA